MPLQNAVPPDNLRTASHRRGSAVRVLVSPVFQAGQPGAGASGGAGGGMGEGNPTAKPHATKDCSGVGKVIGGAGSCMDCRLHHVSDSF